MEARIIWKEGFAFDGRSDLYSVPMDATVPLGHHYGANPKELLLMAIGGCAAMDVIGYLKKHHEFIDRFDVSVEAGIETNSYPKIFESIELTFNFVGSLDPHLVRSAIERSQSTYSGVSAMICEKVPIHWKANINGVDIGSGIASFNQYPSEFQHTSFEG